MHNGGTDTTTLDPEAPATDDQETSTDETSDATGSANLGPVTDTTPKVKRHLLRKGAKATGKGLTTAGAAVIDTDLRDIGQGIKGLGRKVKSHVRMPIKVVRVHECDDPSCPHTGAAA